MNTICRSARYATRTSLVCLAVLILGCGDQLRRNVHTSNLQDPFRLFGVEVGEKERYLVTVNRGNSSVSVYAQHRGRFLDLFPVYEDEVQPVFVGGQLIDAMLWRQIGRVVSLVLATSIGGQSYLVELELTLDPSKPTYTFKVLGSETVASSELPVFVDKGRPSNPFLNGLRLDPAKVPEAQWKVSYSERRKRFVVTAYSAQGPREMGEVGLGETFEHAASGCAFKVGNGKYLTTSKDFFAFRTNSLRPLKVNRRTILGLALHQHLLFSVEEADGQAVVALYTLEDHEEVAVLPVTLSSRIGTPTVFLRQDVPHLLIPDLEQERMVELLLEENDDSYTLVLHRTFDLLPAASKVLYLPETDQLVLAPQERPTLIFVDYKSGTIAERSAPYFSAQPTLLALSHPLVARTHALLADTHEGMVQLLLAADRNGDLRFFDPANENPELFQVDLYPHAQGSESGFVMAYPAFKDELATGEVRSKPRMSFLSTTDGVTKDETFVVTYEGVIPGSAGRGVLGQDFILTAADLDFTEVVPYLPLPAEEIPVELEDEPLRPRMYPEVDEGNTPYTHPAARGGAPRNVKTILPERADVLVLELDDLHYDFVLVEVLDSHRVRVQPRELDRQALLGAELPFHLRANGTYTVVGTRSGLQRQRALEGFDYKSDEGAVGFRIDPAPLNPTTREDAFVFETFDGREPLPLGTNPVAVTYLEVAGRPLAFIANASSGSISVVDLSNFRKRNAIIQTAQ